MTDKSRREFEAWCGMAGFYISRDLDGDYSDFATDTAWHAWLASRAAIEIELPDYADDSDNALSCFDGEYEWGSRAGAQYAVNQCANAVRTAGITVKGEGSEKTDVLSAK